MQHQPEAVEKIRSEQAVQTQQPLTARDHQPDPARVQRPGPHLVGPNGRRALAGDEGVHGHLACVGQGQADGEIPGDDRGIGGAVDGEGIGAATVDRHGDGQQPLTLIAGGEGRRVLGPDKRRRRQPGQSGQGHGATRQLRT